MKESISVFLKRLSDILEFVISFILTAGIILLCLRVAGAIYKIPDLNVWPNYEDLLETCFNLIIGVELIKMSTLTPHRQFSKFSYLQLQDKSSSIILPSGAVLSVSAQSLYYLPHVNSYSVILMMLTNTSSTHLQKQKILPGFFPLTFRIQETIHWKR